MPPALLRNSLPAVSTITAILESDADGSLHLPLPKDFRRGKVKVTAKLEPAESQLDEAEAKMEAALAALGRLRELGTFREIAENTRAAGRST